MKKYILLATIACLSTAFVSGCSSINPSSNSEVTASKDNTEEPEFDDTNAENQNENDVNSSDSQDSDSHKTDTETNNTDVSSAKATSEIKTSVGYILSCDENTIYVDLKNTGGRLYPGEGENRKVAFDISNAEQVQTNISEFNPASDNLIRSGIQVTIEYYIDNGVNIAIKLTSDGDEKEPYSPVAIGTVTSVSDTEVIISVTQGDNIGETLTFNLSVCDTISDPISVDSKVAIAYYTKQDINYAVYAECIS